MNRDAGFTVLEVLVALAVLGVVFVTLLRLSADGITRHDAQTGRLLLAMVAEAALDAERLSPGGSADLARPSGTSVAVRREPFTDPPVAGIERDLEWLVVEVAGRRGNSFRLATLVPRQISE